MSEKTSILESKKLLIIVVIAIVVVLSAVYIIKNQDQIFGFNTPEGIGSINSEHVHGGLEIDILSGLVDLDPKRYPKYLFANDYISLDENKNIHRTATGATVAHLLESMDFTYTDECLIVTGDTFYLGGLSVEQKAYCNEGEMVVRLFVTGVLNKQGPNYVIQEGDRILVIYSNLNINPYTI
ncbi:MAG: hypothetical protein IIA83_00195 [Thaumarchaeota archaeon]|nr:hypothetical protein [Nitrososphaerota archaeon]